MSNIANILTQRSFEKVRDQLASVIATELAGQYTLTDDEDLNVSVFTERFTLPQSNEGKVIIVSVDRIRSDNHTQTTFDSNVTYNIDFFTFAKKDDTDKGYYLSAKLAHKLAGRVQSIIQHPAYIRLGFTDKKIVGNRQVSDMQFDHPNNPQDMTHSYMCRLQVDVRVHESIDYIPEEIEVTGIDTILTVSDKGHEISVNI